MIHEVDSALRTLIEREATGMRDVEIVFDAPTREWAGRRNSPTIDVYLYDIREDLRRRERGMHNVYDGNTVVSRHLPPRHFKLSYLVTAWTQRPEDEHRLLSSLLTCFLRHEALPADVLTGPLAELGLPVPITIALPPPEDRAFADVWSALGGELKPSIDLVVITPLDTGQQFHTGPPVSAPPRVSLGGSAGWPTRETKSRNGVEVWPAGIEGPTPELVHHAGGEAAGGESGSAASASGRGGGSRRAGKGSSGHGRRSSSSAPSGTDGGGTDAGETDGGETDGGIERGRSGSAAGSDEGSGSVWETATGWADAMAPLGSAESSETLPDRTAGRRTSMIASAGAVDTETTGSADEPGGGRPATKGRPGPRVAMTRVRQTKKRP